MLVLQPDLTKEVLMSWYLVLNKYSPIVIVLCTYKRGHGHLTELFSEKENKVLHLSILKKIK